MFETMAPAQVRKQYTESVVRAVNERALALCAESCPMLSPPKLTAADVLYALTGKRA